MMVSKRIETSRQHIWRLVAVCGLVTWLVTRPACTGAITFNTIVSFDGPNGAHPAGGLVRGVDGNFYGTTAYGGQFDSGTVFQLRPDGTFTTLASFGGANGATPVAPLVQASNGVFYGTTAYGGQFNNGTVFQLLTNGALTSLVSFDGTNGANPMGGLIEGPDGNLYGTTFHGGDAEGHGTVFQITANGALNTLLFFNGTNGANPAAGLALGADGKFYGTSAGGGDADGHGTAFQLDSAGTLSTLVTFDGTNGANPYAGLVIGSDGNFYGSTANGGTNRAGTLYRISPSGSYSSLYAFRSGAGDGGQPFATLVQGRDGNLYGTTAATRNQPGTLFRIDTGGKKLTTLRRFSATRQPAPNAALVQSLDGAFYGVTDSGGGHKNGSIFRFSTARRPVLRIVEPNRHLVESSNNVVMVVGRAKGQGGVNQVFCRVNTNDWISATTEDGWKHWTASVPLSDAGAVTIEAYAADHNGETSRTNRVNPARVVPVLPIGVKTNGFGTVGPYHDGMLLELGKTYRLTARPGRGCIFTNWSCSLTNWTAFNSTNSPKLTFVMESNLTLTANFRDVTPPAIWIVSPAPRGKKPITDPALIVIGKVRDNGQATVFYQLNNGKWARGLTGDHWWLVKLSLVPGLNAFQAYAADTDGNVSGIVQASFVYEPLPQE